MGTKQKGFVFIELVGVVTLIALVVLLGYRFFRPEWNVKRANEISSAPEVSPSPLLTPSPTPSPVPSRVSSPSPKVSSIPILNLPKVTNFKVVPFSQNVGPTDPAPFVITGTVTGQNLGGGKVQIRMLSTGAKYQAVFGGTSDATVKVLHITKASLVGDALRVEFSVDLPTTGRLDLAFSVIDVKNNHSSENQFFVTSQAR